MIAVSHRQTDQGVSEMSGATDVGLRTLLRMGILEMDTGRLNDHVDVIVLGRDVFSQLVVVERPESYGGTRHEDMFQRAESPELLPATIGDLLIQLCRYQDRLESGDTILESIQIGNLDQLKKAYRLCLEKACHEGELRSLVELFIESLIKTHSHS